MPSEVKPASEENITTLDTTLCDPALAERYARDLVERARPIGASDRILDLGCGTGILARVLRERLGGAASIVGLDVSPAMIEKARAIAPELDWREGSAMALPFADGSFELVLCQEMLPFVPDRMAALREVRRILSPGGRLLASNWQPRVEQPFDGAALGQALTEAGFTDVSVATVSLTELDDGFGAPSAAHIARAIAPRREQHPQIGTQTHGGSHDVRDR